MSTKTRRKSRVKRTPEQIEEAKERNRQQAQETAERIVGLFRDPAQLPAALAPVFIHRKDCSPCRSWSFANQLLIAMAGHSDARGFRQWQEVGRHVKKGEKSFRILAPITRTFTDRDKETGEEKKRSFVAGFTCTPVFGLAQTDGKPLTEDPNAAKYEAWLHTLPFRAVAEKWDLSVSTYNGREGSAAGWYRSGSAIALGVENLSTWAHELIHAADDSNGNLSPSEAKHGKETVAELGGAILLTIAGHEHAADLGGCWDYVRLWCQSEGKEPIQVCQKMLQRTCSAVALVLDTAEALAD